MIKRNTHLHYYGRAKESFQNPWILQRFLREVAALGFYLVTRQEHHVAWIGWRSLQTGLPPRPVWRSSQPELEQSAEDASITAETLSTPGISNLLRDELLEFASNRSDILYVSGLSTDKTRDFFFHIRFSPEESSITNTPIHIAFLQKQEDSLQVFEHWLKLFQVMYDLWNPAFAYTFPSRVGWPETTREDALAFQPPCVYEINFWSPEIVNRLGRERVLSTPAWKVQPLEDGGVLLVPDFYFGPAEPARWKAVTEHLGFPLLIPSATDD